MLLDFEQLWEKLINGDESTEIEAKRGTVLSRTTERDLMPVVAARAALKDETP